MRDKKGNFILDENNWYETTKVSDEKRHFVNSKGKRKTEEFEDVMNNEIRKILE